MQYLVEMINGHKFGKEETILIKFFERWNIPYTVKTLRQLRRSEKETVMEYIPIGGISFVQAMMTKLGIDKQPVRTYPTCFGQDVYKRRIPSITTLNSLQEKDLPVFIKPAEKLKAFTGFVLEDFDDYRAKSINPKHQLWHTNVVKFIHEIRVYVINGQIGFIGDYLDGETGILGKLIYDNDFIISCVDKLRIQGHFNYAIDFGVLDNGQTALIEMNEGYAIGLYGEGSIGFSHARRYLELLKNRWIEIVKDSQLRPNYLNEPNELPELMNNFLLNKTK